jgi:hypothetical protein
MGQAKPVASRLPSARRMRENAAQQFLLRCNKKTLG